MKHYSCRLLALLLICTPLKFSASFPTEDVTAVSPVSAVSTSVYDKLALSDKQLSKSIFEKAVAEYSLAKNRYQKPVITIIDFTQSSNAKRMYIIDLEKGELLMQTYVAHGRNSGEEFAQNFSNAPESYMSSPGLYETGGTYSGKHGLSLKLNGLNRGVNDNALKRAIVIHGASYVSEDFIRKNGRLGRSQGCPAVSEELSASIIDLIKGGTCVYIYVPGKRS
jgi:hypothetical protein